MIKNNRNGLKKIYKLYLKDSSKIKKTQGKRHLNYFRKTFEVKKIKIYSKTPTQFFKDKLRISLILSNSSSEPASFLDHF